MGASRSEGQERQASYHIRRWGEPPDLVRVGPADRVGSRPGPDVRELAADALVQMERDSSNVRDVVEALRASVTDGRDRGLLTEILYGVARRRPTLDHLIGNASTVPWPPAPKPPNHQWPWKLGVGTSGWLPTLESR